MPPSRSGADSERSPTIYGPGIVYDADGNPLGTPDDLGLGGETPVRPGRPGRRPNRGGRNFISRALRGLGNLLTGD